MITSRIRQAMVKRLAPGQSAAPGINSSVIKQIVSRAIRGVGPLPGAAAAADKQLAEQDGQVDKAVHELIENHTRMAASQGFLTNLGGVVTMAAAIPVNITGLGVLHCRMAAGIAHLRGYDLEDPRVRNAILLCALGEETVRTLVRTKKLPGGPMTVATAPAHDPELEHVVAAEVTSALVGRVVGKRAGTAVVRRIPLAGGVWGAGSDAYATWQIGRYAEREFRPRAATVLNKAPGAS